MTLALLLELLLHQPIKTIPAPGPVFTAPVGVLYLQDWGA